MTQKAPKVGPAHVTTYTNKLVLCVNIVKWSLYYIADNGHFNYENSKTKENIKNIVCVAIIFNINVFMHEFIMV